MTDQLARRDDFAALLSSLQLDARTLQQPVGSTFIPHRRGDSQAGDAPLDSLPQLELGDQSVRAELALADLLGEGGRGEVRRGFQTSLRREVAVKSLKGGQGPAATLELLREARITGGLEHPSIVPVYALGRDATGRVLLVMKKVGGVPWGKLLRGDADARTSDAARERHLEIFAQVCRAVELAHSQGIVHRDLKPDNVMVGDFGEVVVLDWGLAVSVQGDAARGLPPAKELQGLAGTPAYMAPEMVEGDGARIGPFTDIYLLGAILHEIVGGAPPHGEGDLAAVLERAYRSASPRYPPHVPEELAAICCRAMHPLPGERFPSVAALREAVKEFQRHRASALLAAEAQRRFEALLPLPERLTPAEATARQRALAQARFGMEQALAGWPESQVARRGLQATAEAALLLELAMEDLRGAQQRLAELPEPRPALAEQVAALQRKHQAREAEVQNLERLRDELDLDGQKAQRARNRVLAAIGVVWSAVPATLAVLQQRGIFDLSPRQFLVAVVAFIAFVAAAVYAVRRPLLANVVNRRVAAALLIAAGGSGLVRLIAVLAGIPLPAAMAMEILGYAFVGAIISATVDLRFLPAAVVFAVGSVAAALLPRQVYWVYAVADFLALVPMALVWHRLPRPAPGRVC